MSRASATEQAELLTQGLRRCTACKEVKVIGEYASNRTRADGLANWCKLCTKEYGKVRYAKSHPKDWRTELTALLTRAQELVDAHA